jgi:hypothetical protein
VLLLCYLKTMTSRGAAAGLYGLQSRLQVGGWATHSSRVGPVTNQTAPA